jgi:hypothetical protein
MIVPPALRLPLPADAHLLAKDLERIPPEAWTPHFNTDYFEGTWSGVPLTAPQGAEHPILQLHPSPAAQDFVDTGFLARCPGIREYLGRLRCPRRSVRLLKLGVGARIHPHTDHDLAYEGGEVRLHLPILTGPEVEFRVEGTLIPMEPGELWYVNVDLSHEVHNRGDVDRIHLVVDCLVDSWLEQLFREALAQPGLEIDASMEDPEGGTPSSRHEP